MPQVGFTAHYKQRPGRPFKFREQYYFSDCGDYSQGSNPDGTLVENGELCFLGLTRKVSNIEDAIFYLGLKQVCELALATPIIEELNTLQSKFDNVNWQMLWQHSIGTEIVSREILSITNYHCEDDTDYLIGLVRDIGKIVMAYVFPEHFVNLVNFKAKNS